MISKNASENPYNRGNYTIGAPTPPRYAAQYPPRTGPAGMQEHPQVVPPETLTALRAVAAEVITDPDAVVAGTRDWWAGSMITDTAGRPAAPTAVIVRINDVDQVSAIMRIANAAGLPVTVAAGRSNVTGAALPVHGGIVLDVCGLDRIIGFDPISQIVEVEAAVFGDILEKRLQNEWAVTTGHWPSSFAISTVGGWVACRGAGQLSTRYGKIEDMVVGLDVVLADGSEITVGGYPRSALGPDLTQLFVGSEGTLGVITRVRLRTRRLPDYARATAYGFTTFQDGLAACREILQNGATPAVLRLYDRLESGVQFGLPDTNVLLIADEGEQTLTNATIDVAAACAAATGMELDGDRIFQTWLDTRYLTGKAAEGFTPGPGFVADTLEMVGTWDILDRIYDEVRAAIDAVPGTLACSAHESHAYVDGACLYFSLRGDVEPHNRADWYREVWNAANSVLLHHGAGLSHHHGVGLLRSEYLPSALGSAFSVLETIKAALDPSNVLNPGKLGMSRTGTGPASMPARA